jgi:2'-5' RNA ligase
VSQRLFVGVALDGGTRAAVADALRSAREGGARVEGLRWLAPESWHFTLQFLGAVPDENVASVREACARAASTQSAFELELSGAGAFGSARKARVVWVGVSGGGDKMAALADAVGAELEALGFAREERAYSAHLTVARLKTPANVERLLATMRVPRCAMRVEEVTLFRSHLSQQGARYEVVARFALGDGDGVSAGAGQPQRE